MKISIIHGPFCLGGGANGFDFARLWTDRRGLSGSDLGVFRVAQELARLGCEARVYTFPKPGTPVVPDALGPGVTVGHYDERASWDCDVAVSWNEAEPLFELRDRRCKRVVSLQINSVVSGRTELPFVDLWLSPSRSHLEEMMRRPHRIGPWRGEVAYAPRREEWRIVPDGCDPAVYDKLARHGTEKIPGRVAWTSSPDRGLHWLLGEWPKIKRAVPKAGLQVCYELRRWLDHMLHQDSAEFDPSILEQVRRAHYIDEALRRLAGLDVLEVGSLSRRDVSLLQAEAECVPYSADPPIWSEGFSCSLMEACAARSGPVATAVDAFPEIYGETLNLAPKPTSASIGQFGDEVVRVLTDAPYRAELNERARALAERHTWRIAAERLLEAVS